MANEIQANYPSGNTLYYVVRNAAGEVWYVAGQVFEVWGTGGRTADDYDISLTDKSGNCYVGSFDANIMAGRYIIQVFLKLQSNPSNNDIIIGGGQILWSGIGEILAAEEIRDEIDANSTQLALILADTNELQTDNVPGLIAAAYSGMDTKIDSLVVPDEAGTAASLHALTDAAIEALNNLSASQVIAAIRAMTGVTEGGTWTFEKLMKILAAWSLGKWRDKVGVAGTYQILDPDDGSTVIAEITPSQTSPQKTMSIKI